MTDEKAHALRPDGYAFELPTARQAGTGEYCGWRKVLADTAPRESLAYVRNRRTLYALDSGPHENEPRVYAVYHHWQVGDADLVRLYLSPVVAAAFIASVKDPGNYEVVPLLVDAPPALSEKT